MTWGRNTTVGRATWKQWWHIHWNVMSDSSHFDALHLTFKIDIWPIRLRNNNNKSTAVGARLTQRVFLFKKKRKWLIYMIKVHSRRHFPLFVVMWGPRGIWVKVHQPKSPNELYMRFMHEPHLNGRVIIDKTQFLLLQPGRISSLVRSISNRRRRAVPYI